MRGGTDPAKRQGAPPEGRMRPGRSLHGSSWQRTRGLESCTTFRSLWGVICLKPAVKEAGRKEAAQALLGSVARASQGQ